VAGSHLNIASAPALLCLATGLLNLLVGTAGFGLYVELLANAVNPVKAVKLTAHASVLFGAYCSLTGLYANAGELAVVSSLLPFVTCGFLFLVADHALFYASLLREFQIRLTPLLEVGFPLALSLFTFCLAHLSVASAALPTQRDAWSAALAHSGVLRVGILWTEALFLFVYGVSALWLIAPAGGAVTYYKLECMIELTLLSARNTMQRLAPAELAVVVL
jgi:hypothetical protein